MGIGYARDYGSETQVIIERWFVVHCSVFAKGTISSGKAGVTCHFGGTPALPFIRSVGRQLENMWKMSPGKWYIIWLESNMLINKCNASLPFVVGIYCTSNYPINHQRQCGRPNSNPPPPFLFMRRRKHSRHPKQWTSIDLAAAKVAVVDDASCIYHDFYSALNRLTA